MKRDLVRKGPRAHQLNCTAAIFYSSESISKERMAHVSQLYLSSATLSTNLVLYKKVCGKVKLTYPAAES
jgi:hypothetical protein